MRSKFAPEVRNARLGWPTRRHALVHGALIALLIGMPAAQWPAPFSPPAARAADPIRISVAIKNRALANQVQKFIRVTQGDLLELIFTSDEAAELHLHGYDLHLGVEPGVPAVLRVDAKIAGRFPLESHRFGSATGGQAAHDHLTLLHLDVYPK
jgi:hypothetical protein